MNADDHTGARDGTHGVDSYRDWDAAYVLGALSPAERREYESHLAGCLDCQQAVSEVGGMPALLALVQPGDLSPDADPDRSDRARLSASGAEILDFAGARDRRRPAHRDRAGGLRRRRVAAWVGGVAAAMVLVAGAFGVAINRGALPIGQPQPYRAAFTALTDNSITAVVDVVPRPDGTTLNVECQYGSDSGTPYAREHGNYAIYVIDRSGNRTLLKTWYAKPDKQMKPTAETSLPVRRIAAIEIWEQDYSVPLLRATLR